MRYNADSDLNRDKPDLSGNRPGYFDSEFNLISLQDAIDYVKSLNVKYPNINEMGLNLELKATDIYLDEMDIDVNQMLYDELKINFIHTRQLGI